MSNHARRARRHPVTKVVGASGTILTLGAALVAATPGTAGAASIQVTSALDDDGAGLTLREAIVQANGTAAEDDIITFAPALNGQTITLTQGEIEILDDLNIQGPGASLLTVAGSGDAGDRIFDIRPNSGDVTVAGLTLTDGNMTGGGGAIYAFTNGAVTFSGLHVTGNETSGFGGGVVIWGASSASVTGSTFDYNDAGSNGGGLHVYNVDGALTLTGNTFDHNYADSYGGGISLYQVHGATTITGTFTDNEANVGGGISVFQVDGTTSISASITGSEEGQYGGGVSIYDTEGAVTITTSTIANNSVNEFGGGVRAKNTGDITISRSTISGNYASVDGGGIYAYDTGTFTVTNSTISGNEAGSDGGGIAFAYVEGGEPGDLVLTHSTVTRNDADDGGGLYLGEDATIDHTIIADNPTGGDVNGEEGASAELSNSLIGDADLGTVTVTDGGNNEFSADPMLGPLANNGGPTLTHALLDGSPALNSGDPGFAPPPSTDQRGEDRVGFDVIDKGAYEAQPDEPPATGPGGAVPVPGDPSFTG